MTTDYSKHIIVDFDDTLCIHNGSLISDIINGSPNIPLINKLNDLYDKGYRIEIFTARGHLSASSRTAADVKYRPVIMAWLAKHDVKYHKLDFNKPFGVIYIDDKAMRPDELELLEKLR